MRSEPTPQSSTKAGDSETLLRRTFDPLYQYFRRKGFPPEECQELTQKTFFVGYRRLSQIRRSAVPASWLFEIASAVWKNALRNRLPTKRSARGTRLDEPAPESSGARHADSDDESRPEESELRDEDADALNALISQAPSEILESDPRSEAPMAPFATEVPVPEGQALRLALSASRALAEVHGSGRVLHDLRLETILVSPGGEIQFLDMGAAGAPEGLDIGHGVTAEEFLVNLYRGSSPEQISGRALDERSNLFSFGVLLYELLTGESPFRGPTPMHTASRVISLDPLPLRELCPQTSEPLAALVESLLAKEPEDRPKTATELVGVLEGLVPESSTRPSGSSGEEDEITALYDEVTELMRVKEDGADARMEKTLSRLRGLQRIEADRFRKSFEASLDLPMDAGRRILADARALREELESSAAADTALR